MITPQEFEKRLYGKKIKKPSKKHTSDFFSKEIQVLVDDFIEEQTNDIVVDWLCRSDVNDVVLELIMKEIFNEVNRRGFCIDDSKVDESIKSIIKHMHS
jgi:hypothetical protein